jgi:hypothetical protein
MLGMVSDAKTRALPGWALAWRTFFWPITVPVLLATWPLRRVWRWWRGRKAKPRTILVRTPEQQAEYEHLTDGIAAAQKRHIINLRQGYTYSAADDLRAIKELMALRDKLPKHWHVAVNSSKIPNSSPVPYGGSRPEESKRPVTFAEHEKLAKSVQVLTEQARSQFANSECRLAALEAKEARVVYDPHDYGPWNYDPTGLYGDGHVTASRLQCAPEAPEVRVYVDSTDKSELPYCQMVEGGQRWWRYKGQWHGVDTDGCEDPWPPHWRKLGADEARAIVSEWRAWLAAQK